MNEKLKKLFQLLFKKSTANKPNLQQKVGYPHLGSLEANFQDYIKKQGMLGNKGWGFSNPKNIVKPRPEQNIRKNVKSEQLKLDLKRGGCVGPNGIL
jgi:hypothetical protein